MDPLYDRLSEPPHPRETEPTDPRVVAAIIARNGEPPVSAADFGPTDADDHPF